MIRKLIRKMFERSGTIILDSDRYVYLITKVAESNGLYCTYKIGVYGEERQHELRVAGPLWNYWKFKREMDLISELLPV